MKDAVVKVDDGLMKKISEFLKENKFVYTSKKQVVNLAIIEFLKLNKLNKTTSKRGNGNN